MPVCLAQKPPANEGINIWIARYSFPPCRKRQTPSPSLRKLSCPTPMTSPPGNLPSALLNQIHQVAKTLPPAVLTQVVTYLSHEADRHSILHHLPKAQWRQAVTNLLDQWHTTHPPLTSEAIATALLTAQHCIHQNQKDLSLETVWTGPEGSGIPVRRTEQVLLQLIQQAQQEIILVSFAIYKVPDLTQALRTALDHGITLKLIAETSDDPTAPFGIEAGLGNSIAQRAQVYHWDKAKRPTDETGRYGSLHAKVAIADRQHLFITSANLTGYALSLNMEMGLLVHNQDIAQQTALHLEQLIECGVLTPLANNT